VVASDPSRQDARYLLFELYKELGQMEAARGGSAPGTENLRRTEAEERGAGTEDEQAGFDQLTC
jgi:hypothetical protein